MLHKEERLARRRDFAAVYARKRSWATPLLVLYVRAAASAEVSPQERRFGFVVSKKAARDAHDRNRLKRRLRAICRIRGAEFAASGYDAVFVVRSAALAASYADLDNAVCFLMRRAGLLRSEGERSPSPQ